MKDNTNEKYKKKKYCTVDFYEKYIKNKHDQNLLKKNMQKWIIKHKYNVVNTNKYFYSLNK